MDGDALPLFFGRALSLCERSLGKTRLVTPAQLHAIDGVASSIFLLLFLAALIYRTGLHYGSLPSVHVLRR